MSLHLWYSNQLDRLVDILAHLARDERPVDSAADIFRPLHLVVGHPLLEAWLRLGLTRRHGLAAHIPAQGLLDFCEGLLPPEMRAQRLDEDAMTSLLLTLFEQPEHLGHPELEPLRRYLEMESPSAAPHIRRTHLARHLGELLAAYPFERREMLEQWRTGSYFLGPEHQTLEVWQRRLYLVVLETLNRLREQGRHLISLPELVRRVPLSELNLPPTVHIFGLAYVSSAFRELLTAFAIRCEVHIYTLNPCMEFWEDVDTSFHAAAGLRQRFTARDEAEDATEDEEDPFGLITTREDTPALRLWGRPGREHIRLLNAMTECDFRPYFFDPLESGGPTVLNHLKRDILVREPERGADTHLHLEPDDSLRILRCPSIQREVEVVASHIWERVMREGDDLRWGDIAVVVNTPQRDAYLAQLQSVFTEAYRIPHVLLDLDLARSSRFVEAAQRLLDLPLSRFTREEVLTLITHPHVTAALGGDVDIELWQQWTDALGIVHGASHDDHRDTYIERDLFNWEQGLKRLTLGLFMTEPDAGPMPAVALGAGAYVPLPLPPDQWDDASHLILLMRSLIADTRYANREPRPLADWARFMVGLVTAYLEPESTDDVRARHAVLEALEGLRDLDLDGTPLPYRAALELARARLARLRTSRGQALTDGVLVASVEAMRPLPFRVVFMLGMGEGLFPSTAIPPSPLDARRHRRRAGDVSPRERDAWHFLDTLVQTERELILSYVWRDPRTGEEHAPASVVQELLGMLRRGYLEPEGIAHILEKHPLERYDTRYFSTENPEARWPNHIPEARREAQITELRRHFEHVTETSPEQLSHPRELRPFMDAESYRALMHRLAVPELPPSDARFAPGDTLDLSMAALSHFLRSPLQGSAQHMLGLRNSTYTDIMAREDEHFEAPFRQWSHVLSEVIAEALGEDDPWSLDLLRERYRERAVLEELSGRYPTGPFARAQSRRDESVLAAWSAHLDALNLVAARPFHRIRFGETRRPRAVEARFPPLELEVVVTRLDGSPCPLHLRLHGTTSLLDAQRRTALWLNSYGSAHEKHLLVGYLDHALLSASGVLTDAERFAVIVIPGTRSKSAQRLDFAPLSVQAARAWLSTLVTELLSGRHDYLLPIEAVLSARLADPPKPVAETVTQLIDNTWSSCSSRRGPVRRFAQLSPPPDAEAVADRRLGPLLQALTQRLSS